MDFQWVVIVFLASIILSLDKEAPSVVFSAYVFNLDSDLHRWISKKKIACNICLLLTLYCTKSIAANSIIPSLRKWFTPHPVHCLKIEFSKQPEYSDSKPVLQLSKVSWLLSQLYSTSNFVMTRLSQLYMKYKDYSRSMTVPFSRFSHKPVEAQTYVISIPLFTFKTQHNQKIKWQVS